MGRANEQKSERRGTREHFGLAEVLMDAMITLISFLPRTRVLRRSAADRLYGIVFFFVMYVG